MKKKYDPSDEVQRTLAVAIVGLPRFYDVLLPKLLKNFRAVGASIAVMFWRYSNKNIPQTNTLHLRVPIDQDDWDALADFGFDRAIFAEPIDDVVIEHPHVDHPQVRQLSLSPKATASFSWITAVAHGASILEELDPGHAAAFWLICRPDIRLSKLSLARLLKKLSRDANFKESSIVTAARPTAHKVLKTSSGEQNLPIDHFFLGSPQAILKLRELTSQLDNIKTGKDTRQPIVNEFILGQFFVDRELTEFPVRLPYIIWRGNWAKSIGANGRTGLSKVVQISNSLEWQAISYAKPGLHKAGM